MFNQGKTKPRVLILALVLLVGITGLMSGCKKKTDVANTEEYQMIVEEELLYEVPEEDPGVEMWNPYKPLYLPTDLADKLYPLLSEDGINYRYEFHATVDGQDVLLFSVVLGPDDVSEAFLLGQLDTPENGKVNVNLVMNLANPDDWSEEDYLEINAMQERINDFIAQFYADENFTPAD